MDFATPLHWASGGGHPAVVRELIRRGADVNAQTVCEELSPSLSLSPSLPLSLSLFLSTVVNFT